MWTAWQWVTGVRRTVWSVDSVVRLHSVHWKVIYYSHYLFCYWLSMWQGRELELKSTWIDNCRSSTGAFPIWQMCIYLQPSKYKTINEYKNNFRPCSISSWSSCGGLKSNSIFPQKNFIKKLIFSLLHHERTISRALFYFIETFSHYSPSD